MTGLVLSNLLDFFKKICQNLYCTHKSLQCIKLATKYHTLKAINTFASALNSIYVLYSFLVFNKHYYTTVKQLS
jgi:hypothetical protein